MGIYYGRFKDLFSNWISNNQEEAEPEKEMAKSRKRKNRQSNTNSRPKPNKKRSNILRKPKKEPPKPFVQTRYETRSSKNVKINENIGDQEHGNVVLPPIKNVSPERVKTEQTKVVIPNEEEKVLNKVQIKNKKKQSKESTNYVNLENGCEEEEVYSIKNLPSNCSEIKQNELITTNEKEERVVHENYSSESKRMQTDNERDYRKTEMGYNQANMVLEVLIPEQSVILETTENKECLEEISDEVQNYQSLVANERVVHNLSKEELVIRKKIEELHRKSQEFEGLTKNFVGMVGSQQHYYIDESLARILLELDDLRVVNYELLRKERREVIRYIYGLLDILEERATPATICT